VPVRHAVLAPHTGIVCNINNRMISNKIPMLAARCVDVQLARTVERDGEQQTAEGEYL
jgi:hypothetical protein